jgi:hypothetical protein
MFQLLKQMLRLRWGMELNDHSQNEFTQSASRGVVLILFVVVAIVIVVYVVANIRDDYDDDYNHMLLMIMIMIMIMIMMMMIIMMMTIATSSVPCTLMRLLASAARSGTQLLIAIKTACDYVTIEEILADMASMVHNGDCVKMEALNCLNVITHGECDSTDSCNTAVSLHSKYSKISAAFTFLSTRNALPLPHFSLKPA